MLKMLEMLAGFTFIAVLILRALGGAGAAGGGVRASVVVRFCSCAPYQITCRHSTLNMPVFKRISNWTKDAHTLASVIAICSERVQRLVRKCEFTASWPQCHGDARQGCLLS
jgi:hypothetical protein